MAVILNTFLVFLAAVFVLVIAASASRPVYCDQERTKSGEIAMACTRSDVRKTLVSNLTPPTAMSNQGVKEIPG